MCWSPTADLVAGSGITGAGVLSLTQVRRARNLLMAGLPLVFGLHQLVESVVWRGVDGQVSAGAAETARTAWAVIALPTLPVLLPLAVVLAAPARVPRRVLVLLVVG